MKCMKWLFGLLVCGGVLTAMGQVPLGVFGWGGGHASTAEEGAARGMADIIRSSGAANMMNSQAASNYEEARKKNIENRMNWTNTYFDMKRVNKESRDATRGKPPSQEQLVRMSSERLPDRLAQSKLDPVTGAIKWPTALRDEAFTSYRTELEGLYAERAKNGYFSPDQYLAVKTQTKGLRQELQRNVQKYPTSASIDARKFIESLAFEADLDPAKS